MFVIIKFLIFGLMITIKFGQIDCNANEKTSHVFSLFI